MIASCLSAKGIKSSFIENKGNGQFSIKALPVEAQAAPLYGMVSEDIDEDGSLDLLVVGNDFSMEPYSGRHDAFNGLCLKGDGKGNFHSLSIPESGFFVPGDGKALAKLQTPMEELFIATQNQDSLVVYSKVRNSTDSRSIGLKPDDFYADIVYKDGKKRRVEFYYGSTYLSQSSRTFVLKKNMLKVTVFNFKGSKREL